MLFMGEEYGEDAPFQFFTDHIDPFIADATRKGRRQEFAAFAAFADEEVPDPQALETFARSVLDPSAGDPELRGLYRTLLELRRGLPRAPAEVEIRRGSGLGGDGAGGYRGAGKLRNADRGGAGGRDARGRAGDGRCDAPDDGRLRLPPFAGAVVR